MAYGTANTGTDYLAHPTSCGRPLPFLIELKIKDPATGVVVTACRLCSCLHYVTRLCTGKEVPEGERGEVCIRSVFVMRCYYNKEEATANAIDKDGFFHTGQLLHGYSVQRCSNPVYDTGDIGKIEGGFVYILDRLKDLIIRGGENIDCSEVRIG